MHNAHPVYRPDIDGLRAVGILSVVIYHAFPTQLGGGFVGVDIFFVISGFLISSIILRSLQRGDFSFTEFYARRARRIFPALIVVLASSYAIGWFVLLPDEFKQLGKHMAAGAGFVQNLVLNKEAGYFDTASELKPLMHLWSLSIEEQFYLVFPLLIWGAWRLGLNGLSVVTLLALASFCINVAGIEKYATRVFFMPYTRFWELLAGSVLAYVQFFKATLLTHALQRLVFHPLVFLSPPVPEHRAGVLNNFLATFGLLLIGIAILGLNKGRLYPGGWALFPVLGTCLLILAGSGAWLNHKLLASRLLVFVGLISYPLYLWHWPLLSFARIMEGEMPSRSIRITAIVLSFVLAWLTYRLIERPLRFGGKARIKTASLCLLITLVGYVGYNTYKRDGLPFRTRQLTSLLSEFDWGTNSVNQVCTQAYPDFADQYCAKSKAAEPTILLLGDSHSNNLYPGIAEVMKGSEDVVLNFARGGCMPSIDSKESSNPCTAQNNRAIKFVEQHTSVQTIIIASRGPLYLTGNGLNEPEFKNTLSSSELLEMREAFSIGLSATIRRFLPMNRKIILILDVPELGFNPKSCVNTRPLRLTESGVRQPCAISRQAYDERNRDYRALVTSVLKDFPAVQMFDAAAQLCDTQWCWATKDGHILYRDDDHLSVQGSLYVARRLAQLIKN